MPGETAPGDEAALEALRATALATKKQADDAQAALLAADLTCGRDPLPLLLEHVLEGLRPPPLRPVSTLLHWKASCRRYHGCHT